MFDVIVIGAGPAGCTASKALAEKGYRVLLVEKFKMPRYKSCSGILIQKSLDLVQTYFGDSVPRSAMCTPTETRGIILNDAKGNCHRIEQVGANVWRSSFDKWMSDKAAQAGVEIRDGTAALDCKESGSFVTVQLNDGSLYAEQAQYVIDCEGAVGALKSKLMGRAPSYITTYQTYNQGSIDLDPHFFYTYLQPELSEYDAWFNVKDDQLVLGVAVRNPDNAQQYYARFIAYMQQHHGLHIEKQLREDRWLMPRIYPGCFHDCGVGPVFFAGEVAGFLNPMCEGISAGMECGHCIASAIAQHFGDLAGIYTEHKKAVKLLHEHMMHQWSALGSMTATFKDMKL